MGLTSDSLTNSMSTAVWLAFACHAVPSAQPSQWLAPGRSVCQWRDWWADEGRERKEDPGDRAEPLSFPTQHFCGLQVTTDRAKQMFRIPTAMIFVGPWKFPRYSWSPDGKILLYDDCLSQHIRLQKPWGTISERKITLHPVQHSCFSRNQGCDLCELLCKGWGAFILRWAARGLPASAWPAFWLQWQACRLEMLVNSGPEGLVGRRGWPWGRPREGQHLSPGF